MKTKSAITLALCYAENFIFGGHIFGWPALVYVLKKDGIFSHGCSNTSVTWSNNTEFEPTGNHSAQTINGQEHSVICDSQDQKFFLAYTIANVLYGLMALPFGLVYDRFGLRITRHCITSIYLPATLMFAFLKKDTSWLVYPAAAGISVVNMAVLMSNNTVCALAGKKEGTFSAIFSGSSNGAICIFLLIKFADSSGIPRQYSFSLLAVLWIMQIFNTFALLPSYKIINPLLEPIKIVVTEINSAEIADKQVEPEHKSDPADDSADDSPEDRKSYQCCGFSLPKIFHSILSWPFLLYVVWYCIAHVRIQIFVGGLNMWLNEVYEDDHKKVSYYTNVYSYINFTSLVLSVCAGIAIDHRKTKIKGDSFTVRSAAAVPTVCMGSISTVLMSCMVLLPPSATTIYLSLFSNMICRVFVYSTVVLIFSVSFPVSDYGRLYGLSYVFVSLAAFSIDGFLAWGQHVGFQKMRWTLLWISLCTLVFPLFLEIRYRLYVWRTRRTGSGRSTEEKRKSSTLPSSN